MAQELFGCQAALEAIQETPPAEVMGEVLGRHTFEPGHPGLQVGVVAVNALDVPGTVAALAVVGGDEKAGRHVQILRHGPVGGIAIGAEHGIRTEHRLQRRGQVLRCGCWQHLVKGDWGTPLYPVAYGPLTWHQDSGAP
jgi:hypothetical protein